MLSGACTPIGAIIVFYMIWKDGKTGFMSEGASPTAIFSVPGEVRSQVYDKASYMQYEELYPQIQRMDEFAQYR